ncbi:zinc ribbon domain-containing protein [Candidatus Woesearchaeota archaeon]|nr:zinc ribbon domain-containing protein [Candidatus Woesearchaeota archaeon]
MAREYETFKEYLLDKSTLLTIILKTLKLCKFSVQEWNESTGRIQGKTRVSFGSWGENYTVSVIKEDNGVRVFFNSKCAMPTQVIDWGKNKENSEQFYKVLDRLIEEEKENEARKLRHPKVVAKDLKPKQKELKCKHCKAKLDKDDTFCPECGRKV